MYKSYHIIEEKYIIVIIDGARRASIYEYTPYAAGIRSAIVMSGVLQNFLYLFNIIISSNFFGFNDIYRPRTHLATLLTCPESRHQFMAGWLDSVYFMHKSSSVDWPGFLEFMGQKFT